MSAANVPDGFSWYEDEIDVTCPRCAALDSPTRLMRWDDFDELFECPFCGLRITGLSPDEINELTTWDCLDQGILKERDL